MNTYDDAMARALAYTDDVGLSDGTDRPTTSATEARLPAGWAEDPRTGALRCPHRDLSVCHDCTDRRDVVEVVGAYYYDPTGDLAHLLNDAAEVDQ